MAAEPMEAAAADQRVDILLVDDRPDKLLALESILGGLHQNLVRAYSGREALRALLQQDYAVILLDVNMPLLGGKQAFEELRRMNPKVRVVFLTGYGKESTELVTLPADADGFLQKPFQVEDLAAKVRSVLDMRSIQENSPTAN